MGVHWDYGTPKGLKVTCSATRIQQLGMARGVEKSSCHRIQRSESWKYSAFVVPKELYRYTIVCPKTLFKLRLRPILEYLRTRYSLERFSQNLRLVQTRLSRQLQFNLSNLLVLVITKLIIKIIPKRLVKIQTTLFCKPEPNNTKFRIS